MTFVRRDFLQLIGAAGVAAALPRSALALDYPTKPVRWIVPFTPGGPTDILARLLGQRLSERLGQPFIIENRPGAGSNIGTEAVVHAPPDGYTLLLVGPPAAINATLYDKLSFNFIRDIAPVASIIRAPNVLVVNPSVPTKTVPEFVAYAKTSSGKISMASSGNGTSPHIAGELFNMMTGVGMVHVPYRGAGPALTDLLGGQVQVMFGTIVSVIEYVKAGTLRALAVTTSTRADALPDIPAMSDFLRGYEASNWYGVGVPKKTPAGVVDRLNTEINAALVDPKIKSRLADLGSEPLVGSPADFGRLIAEETEKWGMVVRFANVKLG